MAAKMAALLFDSGALSSWTLDSGALYSVEVGLSDTVELVTDTELKITCSLLVDGSKTALIRSASNTEERSSGYLIDKDGIMVTSLMLAILQKLDVGHGAREFSDVGLWPGKIDAIFGQALLNSDGDEMDTTDDMNTKEDDMHRVEVNLPSGCGYLESACLVALFTLLDYLLDVA
ncbi:hypothetical protein CEK25_002250 [Fusarium fujikuroi]|nr:hypothetical protein CEK25_002250 [Fusarium fujikuroi]